MKRSPKENNSIHLGCDKLATELNAKGLDMRVVLKPDYKIRWDKNSVKENIIKPIARAMYGVENTTKLDSGQAGRVWEEVMEMLIKKFPDMDWVDFPSQEQTDNYWNSFTK